jgi:hypothetical protein
MVGKASLIYVIGFATILGYLNFNLSHQVTSASDASVMYYDSEAAHSLAMAGAQMALAKFLQDSTWNGPISYAASDPPGSYDVLRNGRTIRSIARYASSNGDLLRDTVEVYLGQRFNTENSFSVFAWMTNNEKGVFWITGDTINGKMHSNSTLNINGSPVFTGKVTTTAAFSSPPGKNGNNAIFLDGYATKAENIQFPSDLSDLVYYAGPYLYNSDIWVSMEAGTPTSGDGVALVRTSPMGFPLDTVRVNVGGFNGVIAGRQNVHVQGTLDGLPTVTSQKDIYIDGNCVYEMDPRYTSSNDMLGLVAENNVVVVDNPANYNNVMIQASIFARRGSFLAQNHTSTSSGSNGGKRGYIFLLGSIVQNTRGAVGSHVGGILQTGYSKSYTYDVRLANNMTRPPHYPGFYSWTLPITGWWEGYPRYDFSKIGL